MLLEHVELTAKEKSNYVLTAIVSAVLGVSVLCAAVFMELGSFETSVGTSLIFGALRVYWDVNQVRAKKLLCGLIIVCGFVAAVMLALYVGTGKP